MISRPRAAVGGVIAAVMLVAGCSVTPSRDPSGQVTAAASADPYAVSVGDCTGPLGTGTVSNLTLVPCDQAHYWEAYDQTTLTDQTYPGASAVTTKANSFCSDSFRSWAGISTERTKYAMTYFYPTQETWTQAGDRQVVCFAGSDSGGITGTLKGVKK